MKASREFRRAAAWPLLAIALVLGTASASAQQITGLSETTLPRSGRLLIFGTDFGSQEGSGQVLIDGASAVATTWSDAELHVYVPETAQFGTVVVEVQTPAGSSNPASLEVTPRASEDRIRWRFQFDSPHAGAWSVAGPDGTVYSSDFERLYALTPDGGLEWALNGAGGGWPITFGADGTIYTTEALVAGEPQGIMAINPDGTVRWTFSPPDGFDILAGPGVGPDGNIYATQGGFTGSPLGTFALDPAGNLLWNNRGPTSTTGSLYKILFGSDRFFVSYSSDAGGGPTIRAYDYSGNQLWNSDDLFQAMGSHPELDPSGRLVLQWAAIGTQAWTEDGAIDWIYDPPGSLGNVVPPAVGSDGVVYSGTWLGGDLYAVNPDGTGRWLIENGVSGFLGALEVTPDNQVLVDGGSPGFGNPSFIRGFDTTDGTLLWLQNFHVENGLNEFASFIEPGFTPDSRTAYVTTEFSSSSQSGYLYAIDVSVAGGCAANCLRSSRIDMRGRVSGSATGVGARVRVEDETGAPVPSADIAVIWTLPGGGTQSLSASTDQGGFAKFSARAGGGTYTLTVTDIVKTGWTFDPDNSVLTKSITP